MPTRANTRSPHRAVGAILLCAGEGKRLGMSSPKALVQLAGRPTFLWSIDVLEDSPEIQGIVVVGPVQNLQPILKSSPHKYSKVVGWCEGGPDRHDSVARGLQELATEFSYVLIHDCARPLVTVNLVKRVVQDARKYGAAISAVPLDDTLKYIEDEEVRKTVRRANLWRAQTPQVFRRDWLEDAYSRTHKAPTDDASMVEAVGHRVHVTRGESRNLKVTYRDDLELAASIIAASKPLNR